jgi:hypothetical protein
MISVQEMPAAQTQLGAHQISRFKKSFTGKNLQAKISTACQAAT